MSPKPPLIWLLTSVTSPAMTKRVASRVSPAAGPRFMKRQSQRCTVPSSAVSRVATASGTVTWERVPST